MSAKSSQDKTGVQYPPARTSSLGVAMRQRGCLMVVLISVLIVGCNGAKNAGIGGAVRENFAEAAKSPDARTLPPNHEVFDPGTEPAVPSRPTTGTRKQAPVATPQALHI